MNPTVAALFCSFAALASLPAQDLTAGKPAPALHVATWVKGAPVAAFAKDRVHVVEFWATWCGPCIAGMPHLTAVQKKHASTLTVIGVTTEDENNKLGDVEKMVAAKGDTIGYTIAWDDGQQTQKAWLQAARQDGIPCCFVVDKAGTVAWIGHPQWLEVVVPDVIAGKSDPKTLAGLVEATEKRMKDIVLSATAKPEAAIAATEVLGREFPALANGLEELVFVALLDLDDPKHLTAMGETIYARATAAKDADALNTVAWAIVDPAAKRKGRNLELAGKAAAKAVELTARKDPNALDTLARVHAWKNEWKQAFALQTEALALLPADATEARKQLEPARNEYEAKLKAAGG